jgi:hypothetical protein
MKKPALLLFALFLKIPVFAQINMEDTTVQIIGYWSIDDTQSYDVQNTRIELDGKDTLVHVTFNYQMDIKVIDSTATSYTLRYVYNNIKAASKNSAYALFANAKQNLSVFISTDEFGAVKDVLEWETTKSQIIRNTQDISNKYEIKDPADQILSRIFNTNFTLDPLMSNLMPEVNQFSKFHGAKYKFDVIQNYDSYINKSRRN